MYFKSPSVTYHHRATYTYKVIYCPLIISNHIIVSIAHLILVLSPSLTHRQSSAYPLNNIIQHPSRWVPIFISMLYVCTHMYAYMMSGARDMIGEEADAVRVMPLPFVYDVYTWSGLTGGVSTLCSAYTEGKLWLGLSYAFRDSLALALSESA